MGANIKLQKDLPWKYMFFITAIKNVGVVDVFFNIDSVKTGQNTQMSHKN
jgi:predicted tellurium resistance membrane protein TerC